MSNQTKSPELLPDEVTLRLLANGFIKLSQNFEYSNNLKLPYPDALQKGFNRLVAACIQRQKTPPQSIPDLFMWGHKPIADWSLHLPDGFIGSGDTLLIDNSPTEICENWVQSGSDIEGAISEETFFYSMKEACRKSDSPQETYVAMRRLLIEHPVLTAWEFQEQKMKLPKLAEQLKTAYQAAPLVHAVDNLFHCCAHCQSLLLQTVKGKLSCENERCRSKGRQQDKEKTIAPDEEVLWLKRGLRRFISAPGIAELRLADNLKQKGLTVELWPAFDRYDLRITFPNNEAWAVDVKDWANPFLLGRAVKEKPIPPDPPWQHAFFVFPNERGQQRPDYERAFASYYRNTPGLLERKFLKKVGQKLKEINNA